MRYGILILSFFASVYSYGQCSSPVNIFPYRESFEATNGSWTIGGNLPSWEWGTPAKAIINSAASGSRCWITGGLNAAAYNSAENSWIQSPCFNFSALLYPQISFKVFWETEKGFDGAKLQYSTDEGSSWQAVGDAVSAADSCLSKNWYNDPSVRFLSSSPGWAGSTSSSCPSSNGSAGWVTAKHNLSFLAGRPQVLFRFIFGAGTTCNNFDGFAIDDINIENAPVGTSNFSYTCKANRSVDFSVNTGCVINQSWNFGDAASGANNTATGSNVTHSFSAPGQYTVTLTTNFTNGPPFVEPKQIVVLDLSASITNPIKCKGNAGGVVTATASGSAFPYIYSWNTNPPQTGPILNNVIAGNYTVTVSSAGACNTVATITLTEPEQLTAVLQVVNATCTASNGSVNALISGGVRPYSYSWAGGQADSVLMNRPPDFYFLNVTDANSCMVFSSAEIKKNITTLNVNLGKDSFICPGDIYILNPGNFSSYLWQDGSAAPTFAVNSTGDYSVTVTDSNGCTGSDMIYIEVDCRDIYFPSAFTPNDGDGRNKGFGPLGGIGRIYNYELRIYNRYGQLVFYSDNPYNKWDGRHKGQDEGIHSFVWQAQFVLNGKRQARKGSLLLLR